MTFQIIHEDKDFLVVNKGADTLAHRTSLSAEPALADMLAEKYPEMKTVGDAPETRPGVVHRLDRDTSGIVIFARTQEFFDYLKNLFQTKEVKKTYRALVWGESLKKGLINAPIGLKPGTTKRSVRAKNMKMIKEALTEYALEKLYEYDDQKFSLLKIFPHTGRTHQIRVHLLSIHHPVVGDKLYGWRENPFNLHRQFLHADTIEFPLPSGSRVSFGADFPDDLAEIIKTLETPEKSL
jgi:23S rRNA pseudouridine1911/1915/1917 synthase